MRFFTKWAASVRYGIAVAMVCVALYVTVEVWGFTNLGNDHSMLLLGAVVGAALIGGLGPGLLATVIAEAALVYYIFPPHHSFSVTSAADITWGVAFFFSALILTLMATQLRRKFEEAAAAKQAAERAAKARDEILAIVSHDLKSPLTAILMSIEARLKLAQNGYPSSEQLLRRLDENIQRSAHQMRRLINDLLDLGKIEQGAIVLDSREASARKLVDDAVLQMIATAEPKGVRIETQIADGLLFRCDYDRVLQILLNILSNAVKFTPPGGFVRVKVEQHAEGTRFEVADTGPGISPGSLPHVFDRYWQGAETRRKGTGLGLFIARGLVEAHGGHIGVESKPGEGARFWFVLPGIERTGQVLDLATYGKPKVSPGPK